MNFRQYQSTDYEACLRMFDGNVPTFFDASERKDYEAFLQQNTGPYFILENNDSEIIGCGGYQISPGSHAAKLRWGMIKHDQHGSGLGSKLLEERIGQIKKDKSIKTIMINTSHKAEGFYQRYGFITQHIAENFFGPGLHQCEMELAL